MDSLKHLYSGSILLKKNVYKFSLPFFNKNSTKALLLISKDYYGSIHGELYLVEMKKKQDRWLFYGIAPF